MANFSPERRRFIEKSALLTASFATGCSSLTDVIAGADAIKLFKDYAIRFHKQHGKVPPSSGEDQSLDAVAYLFYNDINNRYVQLMVKKNPFFADLGYLLKMQVYDADLLHIKSNPKDCFPSVKEYIDSGIKGHLLGRRDIIFEYGYEEARWLNDGSFKITKWKKPEIEKCSNGVTLEAGLEGDAQYPVYFTRELLKTGVYKNVQHSEFERRRQEAIKSANAEYKGLLSIIIRTLSEQGKFKIQV